MPTPEKFLKDGVYPGTPRVEYEQIEAVNQSLLKHHRKTPAHVRHEMTNPSEPTDAMDLGTALHCAVLEPARFASDYVIAPKCDMRTNVGKAAWKQFEADNPGKEHLTADEMVQIVGMQEAAMAHPIIREIMSAKGLNEVAFVWTDPKTGLRCKGLVDRLLVYAGWTVVVDFKSALSALEWDFAKAIAKHGYHTQAAAYLEGLRTIAPSERRFYFVAMEKKPPYCNCIYEPDEQSLNTGTILFHEYLSAHAKCLRDNRWPGYNQSINSIQIPKYEIIGDANESY